MVFIAGAPKEEWEEIEEIFNQMHTFEIIDMERFEDGEEKKSND